MTVLSPDRCNTADKGMGFRRFPLSEMLLFSSQCHLSVLPAVSQLKSTSERLMPVNKKQPTFIRADNGKEQVFRIYCTYSQLFFSIFPALPTQPLHTFPNKSKILFSSPEFASVYSILPKQFLLMAPVSSNQSPAHLDFKWIFLPFDTTSSKSLFCQRL